MSGSEARSPKSSRKSRKGNPPSNTSPDSGPGPGSTARSGQNQLVDVESNNEDARVETRPESPKFEYVYPTTIWYYRT